MLVLPWAHALAADRCVLKELAAIERQMDERALRRAQQAWDEASRSLAERRQVQLKSGESVTVGKDSYTVLAYLGTGAEGSVFKVQDASGQVRSLKHFKDPSNLEWNINRLEDLREMGLDVVNVYASDPKKGLMVLEYIDGLNAEAILRDRYVSSGLQNEVRARLSEAKGITGHEKYPGDHNFFYEIATGRLVIIDPL